MEKTSKVRLFSAVTLFVSFLCIAVTFFIQIRMQKSMTAFTNASKTTGVSDTLVTEPLASVTENGVLSTLAEPSSVSTPPAAPIDKSASASQESNKGASTTHIQSKTQTTTKKETTTETTTERSTAISPVLVINLKTKKIHSPHCSYLQNTNPENTTQILSEELPTYLESGYTLCQRCRGYAE